MSLDKEIQNINLFLLSKQSIFLLSQLDFANQTEQTAITGYLFIKRIFQSSKQPQKDFQQLSFKNQTHLKNIVVGLFYKSLLFPHQQQTYFNHVRQLRTQALDIYANFFMKLIIEQIEKVNDEALMSIPILYHQLMKYNVLVQRLTIVIIRSINIIDLSERSLTYVNNLIEVLMEAVQIITLSSNEGGVGRLIFIKVLRLLTSIYLIEQSEQMMEFKQRCQNLILALWKINKNECLNCGIEAFRYFQQLLSYPSLNTLFEQYKSIYYSNQKFLAVLPKLKNDQLLAITIPISIFQAIIFSLNTTNSQIYYQMNWFQKDNIQNKNYEMLLIDILRYMVRIVDHPNRFIFIEWIFTYSERNKQTSIIFKPLCLQALFFDWFFHQNLEESQVIELTKGGLMVLGMCQHNIQKCQQMLQFILYQQRKQANKVKDNLRRIFSLSQQKGPFKISQFLNNTRVDGTLKGELRTLMSAKQDIQSNKQYEVMNMARIQSTQSDDIWQKQPQVYFQSKTSMQQQPETQSVFLELQKHYYEQLKQKIDILLQSPSKLNYQSLLDNVIPTVKKVYRDTEIYNKFIQESVKVSYIMFQSHWQCFSRIDMIPVENNIIGIHIHSLVRLWGTSDVALDFHRKMLKGIIKKFKIGMFAVYFIFLMLVPSTKVNCQQVNKFILGDNKSTIQRILGKLIQNKNILEDVRIKSLKYKLNIIV